MDIQGSLDTIERYGVMLNWFSTKKDKIIADRVGNLNRIFGIKVDEADHSDTVNKILRRGFSGNLYGTNFDVSGADFIRGEYLNMNEDDPSDGDKFHIVTINHSAMGLGIGRDADELEILKKHPYVREVADIFSATRRLDNLSLENIREYLKNQEKMYSAEYTVDDFSGA